MRQVLFLTVGSSNLFVKSVLIQEKGNICRDRGIRRTKSAKATDRSNTSNMRSDSLKVCCPQAATACMSATSGRPERMLLTALSSSAPCNLLLCFGEFLKIAHPAPVAMLFVHTLLNKRFSIERCTPAEDVNLSKEQLPPRWTGLLGRAINRSHGNITVFKD